MMKQQLAPNVRSVRGGVFRAIALVLAFAFMGGMALAAPLPTRQRMRRTVMASPDFSRSTRRGKEHETARRKTQRPVVEARSERVGSRVRRERGHAKEVAARKSEPVVSRSRRGAQERSPRLVDTARVVKRDRAARETETRRELDAALAANPLPLPGSRAGAGEAKEKSGFATGVSTPEQEEPGAASEPDAVVSESSARVPASVSSAKTLPPVMSAKDAPTVASEAVLRAEKTDRATGSSPAMDALGRTSREELAEEAIAPRLPGLYARDGKLIMPPPLKGSHEILVHQNEMADAAGLNRILNDAELERLRAHHQLVDFPESSGLRVNPQLPEDRRCARPWTVRFAEDTARAFYARFHEPLQLNSAVRTVSYQRRLERVNGNAAAVSGEAASPHLTGQALDFGKRGMNLEQIAWMRAYLLPLMQSGKLDVEEEFQQACFHISVYKSYERKKDEVGEVAELQ